jgi:hypothetical protein
MAGLASVRVPPRAIGPKGPRWGETPRPPVPRSGQMGSGTRAGPGDTDERQLGDWAIRRGRDPPGGALRVVNPFPPDGACRSGDIYTPERALTPPGPGTLPGLPGFAAGGAARQDMGATGRVAAGSVRWEGRGVTFG